MATRAPNEVRHIFPKYEDRARYNENIFRGMITANLNFSIKYVLAEGSAFHQYFIHPSREFIKDFFLNICRTGKLDDHAVLSASIVRDGQWNGKIALFSQEATPMWNRSQGLDLSDKALLGDLYVAPVEPPPDEIEAEVINKAVIVEEPKPKPKTATKKAEVVDAP